MEALIEKRTGKNVSYKILAAGMGLFMVVVAIALELIFDFKDDAAKYGGVLAQEYPSSIFDYPAWPPILAGLAVGFGQLPVRIAYRWFPSHEDVCGCILVDLWIALCRWMHMWPWRIWY